jgi:hypothetical protein
MHSIFALAALLVVGRAAAQDVAISYAKSMEFETIKTFQYVPPKVTGSESPLMAKRIVELLKAKLVESGLTETEDNADLYVTFHLSTEQNPHPEETDLDYGGYGPGWAAWGNSNMATAKPGVSTETAGTLVVDAYRPTDKKLVWRGTGTLSPASTPIKRSKQIEKILDKLAGRWKKILRDAGK